MIIRLYAQVMLIDRNWPLEKVDKLIGAIVAAAVPGKFVIAFGIPKVTAVLRYQKSFYKEPSILLLAGYLVVAISTLYFCKTFLIKQ